MLPFLSLYDYGIHAPPAIVLRTTQPASDDEAAAGAASRLDAWMTALGQSLTRLLADVEEKGAANIDQLITDLEESESELQRAVTGLRKDISASKKRRADAFRLPPGDRAGLLQRHAAILRDPRAAERILEVGLRALRDARWNLMALRGQTEGAGDSPVFEDSDSMMDSGLREDLRISQAVPPTA